MAAVRPRPRPRRDKFRTTTTASIIITTIIFTTIYTAEAMRHDGDRTAAPTCWSTRGS
jgi:hypothetical protein